MIGIITKNNTYEGIRSFGTKKFVLGINHAKSNVPAGVFLIQIQIFQSQYFKNQVEINRGHNVSPTRYIP